MVPVSPSKDANASCSFCGAGLEGAAAPNVCEACGAPQPLAPGETAFSLFGLPVAFSFDRAALEKKFYELSRLLHPDRFAAAGAGKESWRAISLERMSALNQAYQQLRDPGRTREAMLETFGAVSAAGGPAGAAAKPAIPVDLAEEWFEIQEALLEDPARARAKFAAFLDTLAGKRAESEGRMRALEAEFDRGADESAKRGALAALAKEIQAAQYLKSMDRDVARLKMKLGTNP